MTNAISHRTQFIFDAPCSQFTVRELDIALENHALRAQPTDYSLICRYRLVNNLQVAHFPELTVGFEPMRRQMVSTMYNIGNYVGLGSCDIFDQPFRFFFGVMLHSATQMLSHQCYNKTCLLFNKLKVKNELVSHLNHTKENCHHFLEWI